MIAGILLTIAFIIAVGLWAGRKATSTEAFTTGGGKAGSWMVCGTLMGTLISGQATVGSAQLAFAFGVSAWWFTIGAALGALVLALFFVKPLRHSGSVTLMEIIGKEYGKKAETLGSCLCVIGMFISIMAQIIASSALLTTIFPLMAFLPASLIAMGLMIVYVAFGGLWGTGMGGIVKLLLLYLSATVVGVAVWHLGHGFGGLVDSITWLHTDTTVGKVQHLSSEMEVRHQYGNFLARGPMKDIGSCLSLILGVLSTQTYAQAIWSARSDRSARRGALLSALFIPPIGAACTLVGMYMRANYVTADEWQQLQQLGAALPQGMGVMQSSVQAFPVFVTQHMPGFFGGVVLGTLFITIVGGGSGLTLGASTILMRDLVHPVQQKLSMRRRKAVPEPRLWQSRLMIVLLLVVAVAISTTITGSFLNDLGFLSLGLRASSVLAPLLAALFFPRRFKSWSILASMVAGTLMMLVAKLALLPGDPVFWGMGVAILLVALGWKKR